MTPKACMTKSNKKHQKHYLFYLSSLIYLLTRLQNLTKIPVFVDEAIYIRWAQLIKNVSSLFFIPLTDGKQPLFMWLTSLFLRVFPDPLFASRLVSVLAGLLTLFSLYKILNLLKPKATPLVLFFYVVFPFTFFFDRLALADNLLTALSVLSLFFTLQFHKTPSIKNALLLGSSLGLAWLTKSPALFFVVLAPASVFLLSLPKIIKVKKLPLWPFFLVGSSSVLAFCIYNFLRLSPSFHMIGQRNLDYIWPIKEVLSHPLNPLKPHVSDIITWYRFYLSTPLILLTAFLSLLFLASPKKRKLDLKIFTVFLWYFLPLLASASVAKVFTARYILFTVPFLLILLSLATHHVLDFLKSRFKKDSFFLYLLFFPLFIPSVRLVYHLSFKLEKVILPATESGYLEDWTSGWGIKETADHLKEVIKEKPIVIGTEGSFGTLPDGLQIYLDQIPNLTVISLGFNYKTIPQPLLESREYGNETFILANQDRLKLDTDQYDLLKLVARYEKPANTPPLLFYRLK